MNFLSLPVVSIRDFIPELDLVWLHGLWHRAMHGRWAISLGSMWNKLKEATFLLVAECEGLSSGFCAVDFRPQREAGLTLLLVEPAKQRRGIGTELIHCVEKILAAMNVSNIKLGAGGRDYFWPGLPEEQAGFWSFFQERGFIEEGLSEDLIQDLDSFQIPSWVSARLISSGSVLSLAAPAQQSKITAFERQYFPAWAPYFENEMQQDGYGNILCAQGPRGEILGTLLMKHDAEETWSATRAMRMGTLNTLGIAPQKQRQGIGLALSAGAFEYLHRRGCSHCLIQWTGLAEWYGKLGARPWARYHMAHNPKVVGSNPTPATT